MKPIIDLNKEYGLVFDGGGARGAYQIGAWRALSEAGVKISAVAGTSVGALNGALVCMGDLEKAGHIWKEMAFSRVMDVDDELMEQFFDGEASIREILKGLWKKLADGGIDITPLKELIHEVVDEEKIRKCGKEFCLLTFSVSDMKELDLSIEDIPEGLLEDFLLASAYLLGFKNEPLHGKTYIDGGAVNNVPTASLLKRGYKDLIQVRIFGPGRVPKTTIPEDGSLLEIEPRVGLGSILEFSAKRSRQNLKIGYYDAKRALYGLTGSIYYIEETREECYYELWNETSRKYETRTDEGKEKLPKFVHAIAKLRKDYKMNLKGRSFLKLEDYTPAEIEYLVDLAGELKAKKKAGIKGHSLEGKNIALIFEKPSTRTRCAFTVGAQDEGGIPTYLAGNEIQLGDKESIEDTARVLGRMFDGIEFRGFEQRYADVLAEYSGVPVWNGLTDTTHPTQCLAMLLTMKEEFGHLKGLKVAYLGDGRNNVANSLLVGCAKIGVDVAIVAPKPLWTSESLWKRCDEYAKESGATIEITDDLDGVKGADVIYTDVWISMGEEKKEQERERLGKPYQVNAALMERTGKDTTIFSHCLPAIKEKEVTEEVFEGPQSRVFDEAENRLHTIKAVMVATLGENE